MNTIQGTNVTLSLMKDDWCAYMCASSISLSVNAEVLPIRTIGDGHFAKNTYQSLSWGIDVSGLAILNDVGDTNWTSFDMLVNQLNFAHVRARIAFQDANGDIKSIDGWVMISSLTFNATVNALTKGDASMISNGELRYYDGLIACDATIVGITPAGTTDPDGNMTFTYGYTGSPNSVKYRLDDTGPWTIQAIATTISINGVSNGDHFITIVPICDNGYESDTSTSQSFTMTRGMTCSGTITDITITTTSATPVVGVAGAPTYQYRIDGGTWFTKNLLPSIDPVSLSSLSTGSHTIEMKPLCSNGVNGTGFIKTFSYTAPSTSTINWQFSNAGASTGFFKIWVNGVLTVSVTGINSGTFSVPNGATVLSQTGVNLHNGIDVTLTTVDSTTSTTIDTRNTGAPGNVSFTIPTVDVNGDTFLITGATT